MAESLRRPEPDLQVCRFVLQHDPPEAELQIWLLTAGLYAYADMGTEGAKRHRFGTAMGQLARARPGGGVPARFQGLLSAEPASLPYYMREAVQLLGQSGIALDFLHLLEDLLVLLRPRRDGRDDPRRSQLLLRWAVEYDRALHTPDHAPHSGDADVEIPQRPQPPAESS